MIKPPNTQAKDKGKAASKRAVTLSTSKKHPPKKKVSPMVVQSSNSNLDIVGDNCRKMGDELYREWSEYKDNKSAALALLAYRNVISVEKVKIAKKVLANQLGNGGDATRLINSD